MTRKDKLVIAIDGPAGVGKSTIAGKIAARYNLTFAETGAVYRAVALLASERSVDFNDHDALIRLAAELELEFEQVDGENRVLVHGRDLTEQLRTQETGMAASRVSAIPGVRAALLEMQRRWGREGGVVAEGRDIGTVVFPTADVKIFLTASSAERARRRHLQNLAMGLESDLEQVLALVEKRDTEDSTRKVAPLKPADDAFVVDCSEMDVDEVLEVIAAFIERHSEDEIQIPENFRAGFVSILGLPNAGKSTLLNRMVGQKVAIVTPKPQTTRHRILGMVNRPECQVAFLDTPGIHRSSKALNRAMVSAAIDTIADADLVCVVVDTLRHGEEGRGPYRENQDIIKMAREHNKTCIIVLNKIDKIKKFLLLPIIQRYAEVEGVKEVVPVSSLEGEGVEHLLEVIAGLLPLSPPLFPLEHVTDKGDRFFVTETVREKVLLNTHQEIPHSVAVTMDKLEFSKEGRSPLVKVYATINVERESQKGIIIGKGGTMLKTIGTLARVEMAEYFDAKVHLELHVRVEKEWSRNARGLKRVEYEP